jgi:hypothetical protein
MTTVPWLLGLFGLTYGLLRWGAPARALSYQKLTVRLGPLLALADSLVVHTLFFFASWRFAALYGGL